MRSTTSKFVARSVRKEGTGSFDGDFASWHHVALQSASAQCPRGGLENPISRPAFDPLIVLIEMDASKRLQVLQRHLANEGSGAHVVAGPTASRSASLPRFDIGVMETCLDDLASLKEEVYEVFRHRPDLLPSSLEGLSKGMA